MRFAVGQTPTLSFLLVTALTTLVAAGPFARDALHDFGFGFLMPRACDSYCGADNQYCCSAGQACITTTGRATCTAAGGGYGYTTSTWTETRTYTSTYSTYIPAATSQASGGSGDEDCVPPDGSGEVACGKICCASWQYCLSPTGGADGRGQCMAASTAASTYWTIGTTTGVMTTTQYSAPYRVTSGATITSTATGTAASATTTGNGTEAVSTTTSNQLSGGAIAGIVVGTIAGVILLLLLCACCIIRGAWNNVMAFFGLGKKDRRKSERTTIIEERYSRHGSAYAAGRPAHRTWFGGAGGRPSTVATSRKEKKSSGGGVGWLAGAGAAMLLLLGLRRDDKRKTQSSHKPARSDWSSAYYTDSYTASSPSSASSDRRTRDTRRSRHSRATRASRHTAHTRTSSRSRR